MLDIVGITLGSTACCAISGRRSLGNEIRITLSADVLFDFDSAALRADATAQLKKVAEVLKTYKASPVTVEGHTDSKGADAYNQALCRRSARRR